MELPKSGPLSSLQGPDAAVLQPCGLNSEVEDEEKKNRQAECKLVHTQFIGSISLTREGKVELSFLSKTLDVSITFLER
jgi:hypothetical protein